MKPLKKPPNMRRMDEMSTTKPEIVCLVFNIFQFALLNAMNPKIKTSKRDKIPAMECKV